MKRDKNQYRNQVRTVSVARWILLCLILGGIGVGYVYIKNNQVELGVRRGALEEEMVALARQIHEAEGWIAKMEDRKSLEARLQRADSQLVSIVPSRVIEIRPIAAARPVVEMSEFAEPPVFEGSISGELAQNDG